MRKGKFNLAIKLGIIALIFGLLLVAASSISKFIRSCGYFEVTDIFIKGGNAEKFSYLKGKNIFSIDLKKESRRILETCPDCSSVKLAIVPPNRIFIYFLKRKPVALVKLYKIFVLDSDGVIFHPGNQALPEGLPLITGLETKIFGPKAGTRYNVKELEFALRLIGEISSNKALKYCSIKKIDVANLSSATLWIASNRKGENGQAVVEVRLADAKIKDNIYILGEVFKKSTNGLGNIKYIDLRFSDPIIKFNDAK
jgi:hypothetical protein